jgi:prepilin-type N-terminal cleavage/methylation domain-containing protein
MKRKAFTLIELAIALTIVGLMIGGSFQAVKAMRERTKVSEAKEQIKAAKDAVMGYVIMYPNLPSNSEFQSDLTPTKSTQHTIFYAADTSLSTINNDICAFNTTNLNVVDNGVTIPNVAFVLAHESADYNMQTALDTSVTPTEVHIYGASTKVDDNTSPVNIVDFYDDIVEWVTLAELQRNVNCNEKPFGFLNDRLPHGIVNTPYNATLYVENNISSASINCTPTANHNISFTDPNFSGTPNLSGTPIFDCTATEAAPATRTTTKQYIITIDADTSGGTGGITPGSLASGEECTDNAACASGSCVAPGNSSNYKCE